MNLKEDVKKVKKIIKEIRKLPCECKYREVRIGKISGELTWKGHHGRIYCNRCSALSELEFFANDGTRETDIKTEEIMKFWKENKLKERIFSVQRKNNKLILLKRNLQKKKVNVEVIVEKIRRRER